MRKYLHELASGEMTWDKLNEQGKRSIARKPDLMKAIDMENTDIVPLIAVSRLIDYIRKGKITFDESYYFQNHRGTAYQLLPSHIGFQRACTKQSAYR